MLHVSEHNRIAWDRLAKDGNRFARPARDEDFADPLASVDGPGWLGGDITGKRVLCLAAGGGRQGPIYAAAGGIVTVVDISNEMLELDREVARQRKLTLRVLQASMDDLSELGDATFDIVIQPVSTCYVPDIAAVYREVARLMVAGGIYVSQHKQPTSLQASIQPTDAGYVFEHSNRQQLPLSPTTTANKVREPGTIEYAHNWQQLLGAMCLAGFVIEDLREPEHGDVAAEAGSFEHRSVFVSPYVRIKARRTGLESEKSASIWTPT